MNIEIVRIREDDHATYGVMLLGGLPYYSTLENRWLDNQVGRSCIPSGTYNALRHVSPKFGDTLHLQDVPGRSEIIFHIGNSDENTRGCILVGSQFGYLWGRKKHGILRSKVAMDDFRRRLGKAKKAVVVIHDFS